MEKKRKKNILIYIRFKKKVNEVNTPLRRIYLYTYSKHKC